MVMAMQVLLWRSGHFNYRNRICHLVIFHTHYQEIYSILKTGALFSPVFSIIGIIALVLRKEVETTDFVRFFFLVLAGGSVFLLNEDLNINVPLEIIDLSKRATSVSGFGTD
jgi:hypothetical protein